MKKILHLDLDAFFASVEQLDNPSLRGKPVIVGGRENRGVVSTCSYEAREFGVHSAMPGSVARRKCPQGIFVPVRYDRYREKSAEVRHIYTQYSDQYETLGLDEAYLDVSHYDDAVPIAKELKQRIKAETGLTCSIGLSYNKSLAKIASDLKKPDALVIIRPEEALGILENLPVGTLHGIGKRSKERLAQKEIYTIKDFWQLSRDEVIEMFGKFGYDLYDRARGNDDREIVMNRTVRSVSRETTMSSDLHDREEIASIAKDLLEEVIHSVEGKKLHPQTLTLKIRYADFTTHSKQRTVITNVDWYSVLDELLDSFDYAGGVRLVSVRFSNFSTKSIDQIYQQLSLHWDDKNG
ncbi:DNA polymerase IV [Shimazuella kribbensis]|uniref:DNA polymerase IV n=1 Tax=Shimazuella kribbensis TaxID=139808 RepID=UPI00041E62EE|nr:DNA polymerase IV [Shimazuella kribbensis]